jgi:predicted nucleic acid-binding protein
MGIILDSSIFIAKEREGKGAKRALSELYDQFAGEELAMSIVSIVELSHGVARANSLQRQIKRQEYLTHLTTTLEIHTISLSIALQAGQIDGENASKGIRMGLADLLIGVTALELGYSVATSNIRHFQMIPDLTVLPL